MDAFIPDPAKFKVRGLIRYLCVVKKQKPADVRRGVVAAYDTAMPHEKVWKWYKSFKDGRVYDEATKRATFDSDG